MLARSQNPISNKFSGPFLPPSGLLAERVLEVASVFSSSSHISHNFANFFRYDVSVSISLSPPKALRRSTERPCSRLIFSRQKITKLERTLCPPRNVMSKGETKDRKAVKKQKCDTRERKKWKKKSCRFYIRISVPAFIIIPLGNNDIVAFGCVKKSVLGHNRCLVSISYYA